jgi:hypothetical protein
LTRHEDELEKVVAARRENLTKEEELRKRRKGLERHWAKWDSDTAEGYEYRVQKAQNGCSRSEPGKIAHPWDPHPAANAFGQANAYWAWRRVTKERWLDEPPANKLFTPEEMNAHRAAKQVYRQGERVRGCERELSRGGGVAENIKSVRKARSASASREPEGRGRAESRGRTPSIPRDGRGRSQRGTSAERPRAAAMSAKREIEGGQCSKCGQWGHRAANCKEAHDTDGKCSICGGYDHFSPTCPYRHDRNGAALRRTCTEAKIIQINAALDLDVEEALAKSGSKGTGEWATPLGYDGLLAKWRDKVARGECGVVKMGGAHAHTDELDDLPDIGRDDPDPSP